MGSVIRLKLLSDGRLLGSGLRGRLWCCGNGLLLGRGGGCAGLLWGVVSTSCVMSRWSFVMGGRCLVMSDWCVNGGVHGCLMKVMRSLDSRRIGNGVMGLNDLVFTLNKGLEVKITVGDIAVEWLAGQLVVLGGVVVTVDLRVVVHGLVIAVVSVTSVPLSNSSVIILVSNSP